jgi:hypothetical protein
MGVFVISPRTQYQSAEVFFLFFLSLSPFTTWPIRYLYGRLVFLIFLYVVRRGSGVLSPATHAHPLSSPFSGRHNTNTTTHNIHGRPIRPGIRTLLTSRWCRKSVALPSTTPYRQPLIDIHTHPWPGGGSFLRKNPPPSVGFEPTSAGTVISSHCLQQPCGHRATFLPCFL